MISVFWKLQSDPKPEFTRLGVPISQEITKTFKIPSLCPHPASAVIEQIGAQLRELDTKILIGGVEEEEMLENFVELKFIPLPHLRTFSKTEASFRIKGLACLKAYYAMKGKMVSSP